jgi:hypothetical protein
MIPITSTVCIGSSQGGRRICIPLVLLWLLLLAFALLLLPILLLASLIVRVNPLRAFAVFWQIVNSLKGTNVEFNQAGRSIAIRLP